MRWTMIISRQLRIRELNITSFPARIQPRHGRNTNVGTYTSARGYHGRRSDRSRRQRAAGPGEGPYVRHRAATHVAEKRQPHEPRSVIALKMSKLGSDQGQLPRTTFGDLERLGLTNGLEADLAARRLRQMPGVSLYETGKLSWCVARRSWFSHHGRCALFSRRWHARLRAAQPGSVCVRVAQARGSARMRDGTGSAFP